MISAPPMKSPYSFSLSPTRAIDAPLGVDGDDRVDAAAREVRDQRAEAILDRAVDDLVLARAARRRVQRFGDDGVAPQLAHVVDPLVGVDLEHLLGGVLRAIEALALQRAQLALEGARRDEREA